MRRYTAGVLASSGYHVLEAADGAAALTLVRGYKGDIHVLVTDVIMPGMSGKDLADRIRDLRPKLQVLFISGYTADVLARRGVLQEDVAYLPKPFSADSLVARVRELLSKPADPSAGSLLTVVYRSAIRASPLALSGIIRCTRNPPADPLPGSRE